MDVGVIGVGVMGRNHARVYSELRPVSGLFVYDVNHESAQSVAHQVGATACRTFEEMLGQVEAVSICVPTQYHLEVAKQVLRKSIHILMEKPICASRSEADILLPLIGDGITFGVGHIERFNPIVSEIERISRDPLYVEMNRHNPASQRVTGASVVEDLMIHDIDILRHVLFDDRYSLSTAGTQDVASVLFRFGHTAAYLSASRKSSKKIRRIYIEEDALTIEGDFMNQEIFTYWKPETYQVENERYVQENIIEKVMVNKVEPLKVELKTFLDCVKDGQQFPVTAVQGYENLAICEQIRAGLT